MVDDNVMHTMTTRNINSGGIVIFHNFSCFLFPILIQDALPLGQIS